MVDADIGREPAQRLGQHVMRGAFECGFVQLPVRFFCPVGIFELVLHVEQPDADRRRDHRSRQIDQQKRHEPAQPDDQPNQDGNHCVGAHG